MLLDGQIALVRFSFISLFSALNKKKEREEKEKEPIGT